MKKLLLLATAVLAILACNKTDAGLINDYNKIIEKFKPFSPECRKVRFVAAALVAANNSMNTNNYYTAVVLLCVAEAYYNMTMPEINILVESDGDYLAMHQDAMIGACMDVLEVKGDEAWNFYASKTTQATLQNYVKKHSDKCSQPRGK